MHSLEVLPIKGRGEPVLVPFSVLLPCNVGLVGRATPGDSRAGGQGCHLSPQEPSYSDSYVRARVGSCLMSVTGILVSVPAAEPVSSGPMLLFLEVKRSKRVLCICGYVSSASRGLAGG